MNSFGPFRTIRFCALGVLTLGVMASPAHNLVAAQSSTAIETPDPYYKGALQPIDVPTSKPPEISRAYNFQPAAPSAMPGPLAPIATTPTAPARVATNPWKAPASPATSPNMTKPIKGPITIPPLETSDVWNAPNTPVSNNIQRVAQPGFLPTRNPDSNSFTPAQPPVTAPTATIQSVSPVIASPAVAPQSIIREQPAAANLNQFAPNQFSPQQPASNQFSPGQPASTQFSPSQFSPSQLAPSQPSSNQFSPSQPASTQFPPNQFSPGQPAPNSFQPTQAPVSPKPIKAMPASDNDFKPNFSFKKTEPSSTSSEVIADSQVRQATFVSSQEDSSQFKSPSEQLVKQVGFVQPVPTPVKQDDKVSTFEPGKVVAIVGGEPIFVGDMLFEINQLIERFIPNAPADVKARERQKVIPQILPKFVEAKLLYHGMLSQLPEGVEIEQVLEQAEIEFDKKAMPRLMEAAGVESVTQLDAYLRTHGSSLRGTRQAWARDQMTKFFLSQKLTVNKEVTHQELLETYRKNYDSYAMIAKARWEQLMIRFDRSDSRAAAKTEIEKLSSQVVHGANLAALAKKSSHGFLASDGGQQNWTSKGSLVLKELDDAIFTLPVGSLSSIIETRDGYHVVRVIERVDAGHTSFLEAQVDIKKKIIGDKRKKAYDEHLAKLKEEIPVEYLINTDAIARLNAKNKRR